MSLVVFCLFVNVFWEGSYLSTPIGKFWVCLFTCRLASCTLDLTNQQGPAFSRNVLHVRFPVSIGPASLDECLGSLSAGLFYFHFLSRFFGLLALEFTSFASTQPSQALEIFLGLFLCPRRVYLRRLSFVQNFNKSSIWRFNLCLHNVIITDWEMNYLVN